MTTLKIANMVNMMNKPTIVVLDDMPFRAEWIIQNFCDRVDVVLGETGEEFLNHLQTAKDLILIILDHDLDCESINTNHTDKNGDNGVTVAQKLNLSNKNIPILIWSFNYKAVANMQSILSTKGYTVKVIQYGFEDIIKNYIENLLQDL